MADEAAEPPMTTLNHYQGSQEIFRKLQAVHARRWTLRVGAGILAFAAVGLAGALAAALAAGYWRHGPPEALCWALLVGGAGATGFTAYWFLVRALLWHEGPAEVARFVEQRIPRLGNDLINSVLLADDRRQASPELVQQAIAESLGHVQQVDVAASVSTAGVRRWGLCLAIVAVGVAVFAVAQPAPFGRGLRAVVSPLWPSGGQQHVAAPDIGQVEFVNVSPGDSTVFPGVSVIVTAEVHSESLARIAQRPDDRQAADKALADPVARMDARLLVKGAGDGVLMAPAGVDGKAGRAVFTCRLTGAAHESIDYAVRIGGRRSPASAEAYYKLHVLRVEGMDLLLVPPPYTGVKPRSLLAADESARSFEAPQGTQVTLLVRLSGRPQDDGPASAAIRVEGKPAVALAAEADGKSFSGALRVDAACRYRIEVKDAFGRVRLSAPAEADRSYEIKAVTDSPPKVAFVAPNRDVAAAPGQKVPTQLRISDDYGLTRARLFAGSEGQDAKPVHEYAVKGGQGGRFDYSLEAPPSAALGSVIVYYAEATDNRQLPGVGGPQTARSSLFKVLVQDSAALARAKAARYEELRQRLAAILRLQEEARVKTDLCRSAPGAAQAAAGGSDILTTQEQIKALLTALAYHFPFDADMAAVQQAVANLARDDAQLAIDQARVLAALRDLSQRGASCSPLAATQDRIIDALRTLLAVLPSLRNQDAKAFKPGDDLSPEAREKLEKLKKDMERLVDSQKKVVEASERLAKKPVDHFNAEDEKLLKALMSVQDEWEKFLNEAVTDFSKLAQQDFSNPAMLKELISVKSDVTMAKDALQKKAVEIATAFEDNGIENAKALTANIEKWLPDTPDRAKWSMEDPAGGQQKIEQPELPKELEDLVGDLLEQEEDLFDQADDVTGKYTMSGDKGIGWDAMDGPIANMNAQGVTGNQLPNTNEMGGRSGEGRQGKSSGEFVEDKAVGKGGRRTPTRLTPEPFQKGQVNDQSADPPGGATGGGKLSGSGAEGLEGPVPPQMAAELKRLAGKQAVLLNRAERLGARFPVADYANFRFLQAVTLMTRVKNDLDSYRYRNVLRSREQTLESLRQTRLLLAGQVDAVADPSQTMPKYVRQDIADARKGELPEKFRLALEEYYRRLSEQAGK